MKEQHQAADQTELEQELEYRFRDPELLTRALTHSSFCNESTEDVADNERLEFLGDAIISTVIAESAFRQFPDSREGELTRLKSVVVSEAGLSSTARKINLGRYVRLGYGAATADCAADHPGVLCDAFEAVIGAIYLDGGFDSARQVILKYLADELTATRAEGRMVDAKTELQMLTYSRSHRPPTYNVVKMDGPAHAPVFTVTVTLPDGTTFNGTGRSKKEAQQAAAATATRHLRGFLQEDADEDSPKGC